MAKGNFEIDLTKKKSFVHKLLLKSNTDIIISLNIEINIEKKSVPKIIISKDNDLFSSRVNNSNNFNSNSIIAVKNEILGINSNRAAENLNFSKVDEINSNISYNQSLEERLFEKHGNNSNISFDNINLESRRKLLNQMNINSNTSNNVKNNSNFLNVHNLSSINYNQFKTNETDGDADLSIRIFNKNESSFHKGLRELNKRVTSTSYINNLLEESDIFTQNSLLEDTIPRNFKDKYNSKPAKNISIKRDSDSDTEDANNTKRSIVSRSNNKNRNQNNSKSKSRILMENQFEDDCFKEKQEKYKLVDQILNQLNNIVDNLELENDKKKNELKEMNKCKNHI